MNMDMVDALVCPVCGGVYMPAEIGQEKMCATPGCSHEGKPLVPRELMEMDTVVCQVCHGRFLVSAHHQHAS